MISWRGTIRGFVRGEFTDQYGMSCSVQASSLADEDCIWLGGSDRMHLTREMAGELGEILTRFSKTGKLTDDVPNVSS